MHRSGIAGNGEESFALSQCTQNLLQRGALFIMPYIDECPIDGVFAHHRVSDTAIFQIHCVPSRLSPLPSDGKSESEAGGCPGIASALTTSVLRPRTFRFVKRNPIRSGQIGDPEPGFLVVVPKETLGVTSGRCLPSPSCLAAITLA